MEKYNNFKYGYNIKPSVNSQDIKVGNNGYPSGIEDDNSRKANKLLESKYPLNMNVIHPIIEEIEEQIIQSDGQFQQLITMEESIKISIISGISHNIVVAILQSRAKVPEILANEFARSFNKVIPNIYFDSKWILENPLKKDDVSIKDLEIKHYQELGSNRHYSLQLRYPIASIKVGDYIEISNIGWVNVTKIVYKELSLNKRSVILWSKDSIICQGWGNEELRCFVKRDAVVTEDNEYREKTDSSEKYNMSIAMLDKFANSGNEQLIQRWKENNPLE